MHEKRNEEQIKTPNLFPSPFQRCSNQYYKWIILTREILPRGCLHLIPTNTDALFLHENMSHNVQDGDASDEPAFNCLACPSER